MVWSDSDDNTSATAANLKSSSSVLLLLFFKHGITRYAEPVAALCVCVQDGTRCWPGPWRKKFSRQLCRTPRPCPSSFYASLQGYRWLDVLNTLPRTPAHPVSRLPSLKRRVET